MSQRSHASLRTGKEATPPKRPTLGEWLTVKLDFPPDLTGGGLRLDMRGRNSITIHGCRRILAYAPGEVRLALKDSSLCICGERLICTAYLAGAVSIEGYVCSIHFCDGEETV